MSIPKLVPAAFDPQQADIKEASKAENRDEGDDSDREREYAGRIESASERFKTPVVPSDSDQDDELTDQEQTG